MSSWHSNSRIILALATGALLPFAMPSSTRAGDKIEFSAPVDSLAVPQVEREDKEPVKLPSQSAIANNGPDVGSYYQAYSQMVIISTPKKKDQKTEDSDFKRDRDIRDSDDDTDSVYDTLDTSRRPVNPTTNSWDEPNGLNPDSESVFSERRGDGTARQDSLHGRMDTEETMDAEGKTDYQKDEFRDRHSLDSDEDSPWSRSANSRYGSTGLERMRDGQFVPLYEEMKSINEQAAGGYSAGQNYNERDGLLHDSTSPYGADRYPSQMDDSRGKTADESVMTPGTYQPLDTSTTVSQTPNAFARQEPPSSPSEQVQSPPAILPFPKRPGSVFQ